MLSLAEADVNTTHETDSKVHILSSSCFCLDADEAAASHKTSSLQLTAIKHDKLVNISASLPETQLAAQGLDSYI